jgi:hypothetical protein
MVAIGCRFGEDATGSYGFAPPATLVHVDINADVFHRNFPATLALEADGAAFVSALLPFLVDRGEWGASVEHISAGHRDVKDTWRTFDTTSGFKTLPAPVGERPTRARTPQPRVSRTVVKPFLVSRVRGSETNSPERGARIARRDDREYREMRGKSNAARRDASPGICRRISDSGH